MTVSSMTPHTSSATSAAAAAASTAAPAMSTDTFTNPASALNQTDFLKLLVAQIQYQDPMNPQSDTQMASQLAQFTSLQQSTQSTSSLAMMQANSLIGSTVNLQVDATHTASGVVTGVVMNNNTPELTVGGSNYTMSQVTSITPPALNSTVSNTANAADASATPATDTTASSTTSSTQTTQ
jgi:flagellar basal-body rod modification protein FlgD